MMRCDQGVTVWSPYLDPRPCFSDAGDRLDQACHGWRIVMSLGSNWDLQQGASPSHGVLMAKGGFARARARGRAAAG